jgi:hypothetical protein
MKANTYRLIAQAVLGLTLTGIVGCAGPQPVAVLKPVGPVTTEVKARPSGYLVVNSARDQSPPQIYFDTRFYPHTGYSIYDSHGVLVRTVRNHLGSWDETLERVSLPPGRYTVYALSEAEGEVAVPVIIQQAKTTVVNLPRHEHSLANL